MTVPLQNLPRFINWKAVPKGDKVDKLPCDAAGTVIDAQDPAHWRTFADASASAFGVGVMLAGDGYFCVDVDGCIGPDGKANPEACEVARLLPGACWEISQSGKGLHFFGRCDLAKLGTRRTKWHVGEQRIEFYTDRRFIAFGSRGFTGDPEIDHTEALAAFVPAKVEADDAPLPAHRDIRWSGPEEDGKLWERMHRWPTKGATLNALLDADPAELGQYYPDANKPDGVDYSSADMALMSRLAFATGNDPERMERMFSKSKLALRDKWQERADYRNRTMRAAIAGTKNVYNQHGRDEERRKKQIEEARLIGAGDVEPPLPVVMTPDQMLDQLVMVGSKSTVHRKTKGVRSVAESRIEYAASTIVTQGEDGKVKEAPVFPVWLKNPARKTVDTITWAPGKAEFCRPPENSEAGARAYNMWRGVEQLSPPPDWEALLAPWHDHLAYLVPDEAERKRFLQWIAHIIQKPGELPSTCYLMITPTRGIGRNWLTGILARVLRGYMAAGVTLGDVLDGGFNGRLSMKLLATVDETREGQGAKRYERGNALQRIITEETRLINPKFGLQRVEYNCCRWLMLSNFPDALPFDPEDRRVIVIANPEERQSEEYYARLYGVMNDANFIAAVWQYLATLDLSDFNPGGHAPMNAAKAASLVDMESETDKLVRDFAEAWPGKICGRDDLRRFVKDGTAGAFLNERALDHAMKRIGLITTGRRIRIGERRDYVIIVREATPKQVEDAEASVLARSITEAARNLKGWPSPPPG